MLTFRPREAGHLGADGSTRAELRRRLDLSRYERPRERPEDFKATMIVNLVVLVLLVTFATTAAAGVIDCEQRQDAAPMLLP